VSSTRRFWLRLRRVFEPRRRGFGERPRERAWTRLGFRRAGIAVGTFMIAALLVTPTTLLRRPRLVEGALAKRDIVAPYKFAVEKDRVALEKEQDEAAGRVIPVFRTNPSIGDIAQDEMRDFFVILGQLADTYALKQGREREVFLEELSINVGRPTLVFLLESENLDLVKARSADILASVMNEGVLDSAELERRRLGKTVALARGDDQGEDIVSADDVLSPSAAARRGRALVAKDTSLTAPQAEAVAEIVVLHVRPNVLYDQPETERRRRSAREAVDPLERWVSENEKIVERNKAVTAPQLRALNALYSARTIRNLGVSLGGRSLLVFVVLAILAVFFMRYRPELYRETRYWWMMGTVIAVSCLVSRGLSEILGVYAPWSIFIFSSSLGAMLITLMVDMGLGFVTAIVLATLGGVMGGVAFRPALVALGAATSAVFAVSHIRRRYDYYVVFAAIAGTAAAAIVGIGLIDMIPWQQIGTEVLWGTIFAAGSVVLLAMVLPIVEMTFHIVTDLKLLELADLNQPLLRKLFLEAPGTYHHSVVVGSLAESAAAEVQANPLLARVAAYYHDVGKVRAPAYFAENAAAGAAGRHENLSPQMSTLVVASHTKQGARMAEEAGLPPQIVEVIAEHHGTSLISFFYQEALKLDEHKVLAEDDFRYPGPKPRGKIAAIIMLADAAESATRALEQPTPTSIRSTVEKITAARLQDGQLSECDLSLREIGVIEEVFIKNLTSIYHVRPTYPHKDDQLVVPYLSSHTAETKPH
jgi:putative nucleotidyltransferase with HDIG domain